MGNSDMQALSCIWSGEETQKPHESWDKKYWKKIFLALCLCAVLIDPLFLYIPILKDDFKCLMLDPKLKIAVLLLRSVIDFFYLMDIIIRIYRSENYSSLINELNHGQQQMNFNFVLKFCVPRIAKAIWASSEILIDIVTLLPLPQVAILIFFSKMSDLRSLTTTRMVFMNIFALVQYMPRVFRIYFSPTELKKTHEEEISETPTWIKGVLYFCMYIIASHVVGALWYFFAIQRMMMCWHSACHKNDGCDNRFFGCHDHHAFRNTTILNDLCPVSVSDNSSDTMLFSFGIFATVLQYGVVGSTNYFQKFLNCFWWGLRNLSSFGSNLEPSVDGWENLYTVFISITGLLLFLYVIGNLQMYMQFESTRTENLMQIKRKMKGRDKEIELWLFKKGIPTSSMKDIKLQIREKVQQAVQEDTYNNLDNILPLLPLDVQRRIEESFAKLKQVPMLQGMDEGLLKIIHERLKPVRYTENMFIIQKGEILEKMFYIVDGFVSREERSSDDLGRDAGELCGQELLRWRFYSYFPHRKPLATESVKATGVVEALALNASDLQSIYDQSDILQKEKPRHKRMIQEEMERSIDGLISKNGIPEESNQDVKLRIIKELFQEDKTVYWDILDWYHLVSCLPPNFENEMKSYMPLTKLKKMPEFRIKDDKVLKEICSHLRPKKYNRTDSIIEKGDPIQMLLIVKGRIGHQGRVKGVGEIYGKEPLVSPFSTSFLDQVSTAAESPSVITDVVEALVLMASDMERIATKFRKRFTKNYDIDMHNLRKRTFLRFFTEEEVKRATRNYTCLKYPNEGGYGTVYHTKLYGRAVAIKTCNIAAGDPFIQSQRLVHEAFVRSEIKHRNVESLFGCCLKTTWPIMVYLRFNALSLVEHFHRNKSKLSLESRMKIAAETAGALAYVHSKSIIHRDVKTANILIDQTTHTVIVSGFGASRLLHEDERELEDEVPTWPGTLGYVDPEYLESHVLTKSDVYGFGVVLVELLTHKEAVSSDKPERSLANDFVCKVQEGRLGQILDGEINRDEFSFEIAKKVSELAMECLRSRAKERPSMKKVAAVLEGVVQTIIKPSTVGR
ncbi:putative cyclic nucleotide-gated ion channel 13 [Malus sylvestris]|uniref:putative cyclic nucleotide-gated ion channel 13 n=1 Tax=Malus sylvestris TaxID=3752 RepID=UPI0021AD1AF8|nr:putative cyclic nucleotide-gated ion channel 13 [Malus sylvestris]XP_050132133.1 putative cyclic nucleotide-gated ion channel 13 [Malus sylvestris]